MIQFLNKWLSPADVLVIGLPYMDECTIVIEIEFMFRDKPVVFRTYRPKMTAIEFGQSEEYQNLLQIVKQCKEARS